MAQNKSAIDLYIDDIKDGRLNGYGRIPGLSEGQVNICLSIAKAVTDKHHEPTLSQLGYETKENLQEWSKTATQTGISRKIFDDYAINVMRAYDELVCQA